MVKRSDRLGRMLAALPLVTVLVCGSDSSHASLLFRHASAMGFWIVLLASCLMTVVIFWVYALVLRRFGIALMWQHMLRKYVYINAGEWVGSMPPTNDNP